MTTISEENRVFSLAPDTVRRTRSYESLYSKLYQEVLRCACGCVCAWLTTHRQRMMKIALSHCYLCRQIPRNIVHWPCCDNHPTPTKSLHWPCYTYRPTQKSNFDRPCS